jgi:hypothetical protein
MKGLDAMWPIAYIMINIANKMISRSYVVGIIQEINYKLYIDQIRCGG